MITAVDTNVLIDVFGNDPLHGRKSAETLRQCLREGSLAACDVVWAETRAVFDDDTTFETAMRTLGVRFSPLGEKAATHAGFMTVIVSARRAEASGVWGSPQPANRDFDLFVVMTPPLRDIVGFPAFRLPSRTDPRP